MGLSKTPGGIKSIGLITRDFIGLVALVLSMKRKGQRPEQVEERIERAQGHLKEALMSGDERGQGIERARLGLLLTHRASLEPLNLAGARARMNFAQSAEKFMEPLKDLGSDSHIFGKGGMGLLAPFILPQKALALAQLGQRGDAMGLIDKMRHKDGSPVEDRAITLLAAGWLHNPEILPDLIGELSSDERKGIAKLIKAKGARNRLLNPIAPQALMQGIELGLQEYAHRQVSDPSLEALHTRRALGAQLPLGAPGPGIKKPRL